MSEESSGGGLKNAIIGLVTIIVTAIAGVIGKQLMGGDEATTPPPAAAPVVINLDYTKIKNGSYDLNLLDVSGNIVKIPVIINKQ